ncbi:MAG: hypothetical protein WBL67_09815 [Nitrososphaeraceae archaeon]
MSMAFGLNENRSRQTTLRINGVLPDIARVTGGGASERAAEIKRIAAPANASCSIISSTPVISFTCL